MEKEVYDMMRNEQYIHWWFVGKRKIVTKLFEKFCWSGKKNKKILDIGCGMGVMLENLSQYGEVYGCDIESEAIEYCSQFFGDNVKLGNFAADKLYNSESFDAVVSLDVLEHIQDDRSALREIQRILKPRGKLVITVPAQMKQWSYNDEVVHHYRRYEYDELKEKIREAGFHIEKLSFYNSKLYPFIIVIRKIKVIFAIKKQDISVHMKENIINTILRKIFESEYRWLLKRGYKYGVSLIVIATKL